MERNGFIATKLISIIKLPGRVLYFNIICCTLIVNLEITWKQMQCVFGMIFSNFKRKITKEYNSKQINYQQINYYIHRLQYRRNVYIVWMQRLYQQCILFHRYTWPFLINFSGYLVSSFSVLTVKSYLKLHPRQNSVRSDQR